MFVLDRIIKTIENITDSFEGRLKATEKKALDNVLRLVKDLEISRDGKVVPNTKNLKLLQSLKTALNSAILNKDYLKSVKDVLNGLGDIQDVQKAYYSGLQTKPLAKVKNAFERYDMVRKMSMDSVKNGLLRTGIEANITNKVSDILLKSITTGGSYADLTQDLTNFLTTNEQGEGALSRYARTWTVTSVNEFAGQINSLMSEDLGFEWFVYRGSNIETTREFCEHLTKKEYIHKSELAEIIKGNIDGHKCEIYPKTGLPKGMKEGTTVENFAMNRGGWNCGHQLSGVPTESVPKEVRERLKNGSGKTVSKRTQKQKEDVLKRWNERNQKRKKRIDKSIYFDDIKRLKEVKVKYNEVKPLKKGLDEEDIIQRVAGGDKTSRGSCASVSLAYIGNKAGLNVLDFRGGKSHLYFARNIDNVIKKAGGKYYEEYNDIVAAQKLVKNIKLNKEYLFAVGKHASIIRKTKEKGIEFLELQSPKENGYKSLTIQKLKTRFGCRKSHSEFGEKYKVTSSIIEIEILQKSKGFKDLLGYINTAKNDQMKGITGKIK